MKSFDTVFKKENILLSLVTIVFFLSFLVDTRVVMWFQSIRNELFDSIGQWVSFVSDPYVVFLIIFVIFAVFKRKFLLQLVSASLLVFILTKVIKLSFARPRPFTELGFTPLVAETGFSFVSGHTLFMFALLPVFYFVFRKKGAILWLILSIIVAISRLYFGVHYPSDVLASIVLGTLIGRLVLYLEEKFFVRWKSLS